MNVLSIKNGDKVYGVLVYFSKDGYLGAVRDTLEEFCSPNEVDAVTDFHRYYCEFDDGLSFRAKVLQQNIIFIHPLVLEIDDEWYKEIVLSNIMHHELVHCLVPIIGRWERLAQTVEAFLDPRHKNIWQRVKSIKLASRKRFPVISGSEECEYEKDYVTIHEKGDFIYITD